jgi:hypothetical protein
LTLFAALYQFLKKIATWPVWIFSLLLLAVGYFISNSDFIGAEHVRLVSGGTPMLDTFFFYTPDRAYELLSAMGAAGRSAYLTANLVDFFFPLAYTLFFVVSMVMTYTFIYQPEDKRNWLVLLPFVAMLADYGENICVRLMLLNFPTQLNTVALAASLFTPLKFSLIVGIGLLILQGNMKVTNKLFGK